MKLLHAVLSGGLIALASVAVHAQTISVGGWGTQAPGDLVLGFDDSNSEPSAGDLLVNIGSSSDYLSTADGGSLTPGTTYTVSAYDAADLTTVYGSTEVGNGDVGWTVFGGNGSDGGPGGTPTKTLWLSSPTSTSISRKTGSLQITASNNIDNYIASLNGAPTTGLAGADGTQDTGYASVVKDNGTFGYLTINSEASTAGISGSGTVSLTLYQLLPTSSGTAAGVDMGTFTLSSSKLTFTPFEAIPEPSTYAAILGALTIGFVLIRRRSGTVALGSMA